MRRAERDLRIERILEAPVAVVWQLRTDPEHFKAWCGPEGVTMPSVTMEVRVGGSRHVCMEIRTPNGPMQMWFAGEYREVIARLSGRRSSSCRRTQRIPSWAAAWMVCTVGRKPNSRRSVPSMRPDHGFVRGSALTGTGCPPSSAIS